VDVAVIIDDKKRQVLAGASRHLLDKVPSVVNAAANSSFQPDVPSTSFHSSEIFTGGGSRSISLYLCILAS